MVKKGKFLAVVLAIMAMMFIAGPALANWVSVAAPSEVIVRNPIVVAESPDQPINSKEIDPGNAHIRRVTVSNVSTNRAYRIIPSLQIDYTVSDGQNVRWDGMNPSKNPESEFGAARWVNVSVFDNVDGAYLKTGEAIILSSNTSRTFIFYIWFTGDAWPGRYRFLPVFDRSEVLGKGG